MNERGSRRGYGTSEIISEVGESKRASLPKAYVATKGVWRIFWKYLILATT